MTRQEQIAQLQSSFDDAVAGKIDIHAWTARASPYIDGYTEKFRFIEAARDIAARGDASAMHEDRLATIRSMLAIAATSTGTVNSTTQQTIMIPITSGPLPAERDIPKVLAKEHGLLWLVIHGHWLARFKILAFLVLVFGAGVQAAQNEDFMKVWNMIIAPITFTIKLLTK